MAKGERGEYRFTVKEDRDGTPWLMAEPMRTTQLSVLQGGVFGLRLRPGTTPAQATALSEHLHEFVEGLSYTHLT